MYLEKMLRKILLRILLAALVSSISLVLYLVASSLIVTPTETVSKGDLGGCIEKDVIEMTIQEISEKLGYEIKIIK